ncbi:Alpha-glucosidase 2 [Choanephora cucurbitarum]|uniref:Alpha-glucosidase 2 n=1 Tax=Choanephora cucurbitarum TaxID=101091 RepID=A0A1C7N3M1_9FUNG|nr:Alpha-glucosidase 2 [Choanephora cucurbitarum]
MRQTILEGFELSKQAHPFIFKNSDGYTCQITVIEKNVIRVQIFTEHHYQSQQYDNVLYSIYRTDENVTIETSTLRLVVTLTPAFQLSWYSIDSQSPFAQDLAYRSYGYDKMSGTVWHYLTGKKTHYYGLGERSGDLDLTGRHFRLERMDSMGYDAETSDPLYKFCPFYIALSEQSREAYGLYYNNFSATQFDLGQEVDAVWGDYTYYQAESGPLDYYMLYGPSVASVVRHYADITGRPRHLPPRYSLGYLASSMGYAEAENAQYQIENFVKTCRRYDIPCDGIHLSSGYTVNEQGDRCVFTWNTSRFPDPERLAKALSAEGIKIFANARGLVWSDESDTPSTVMQWRAGRNTKAKASYIDFTSQSGYEYWKSHLKSTLLNKGYLLWLDNNEFTMYNDGHTYAGQVRPGVYDNLTTLGPRLPLGKMTVKEAGTSIQTLMMAQASYEALIEYSPIQRPFLISRSATPYCNQLVTQTWSGDNRTDWKTIQFNVPMGISAGLCNMPAGYGHDVGGFAGPKPDPEMFIRWIQQGVFWPRFCIHSWNDDDSPTEPWMYPEALPTIRAAMRFRYKLIPYIYSLYVQHAYRSGEPLIRPVFYEHQYDTSTYQQQSEFMLGPSLLIAPVFKPGQITRTVHLPSCSEWYHYQTGTYYTCQKSDRTIDVSAALDDEIAPLFIKAGSMLYFGKSMKHVGAELDNERRVHIFPEREVLGQRRYCVIFEDDGNTLYHETGKAYAEIHVWMEAGETIILVGLEIVHDGYFPDYDTVWITCPVENERRKLVFEDQEELQKLPEKKDSGTDLIYTGLPLRLNKSN